MPRPSLLRCILGLALCGAGAADEAFVFALSFRRNLEGSVGPACGLACAAERLPPAAALFAGAGGPAFRRAGELALDLGARASEVGCAFGAWAAEALAAAEALPGGGAAAGAPLQVFLLPAAAGGGGCARFALRAEPRSGGGCRLWVRDPAPGWAGGLGACFGLAPARAGPAPEAGCDPADALCPFAPPGLALLPPHRRAFGGAFAPLAPGGANLSAGAVLAAGPWLFFLGGAGVRVYQAAPLAFRAELAPGGVFDDSAGAGLFVAVGGARPGGAAVWAEFCSPGLGRLEARRGAFRREGAFWRLDVELVLSNADRRCPPRGALATLAPGPGPSALACNLLEVFVRPDANAAETTYELRDAGGVLLLAGGGSNSTVLCAPAGAPLRLVVSDAGGDGLCCRYGGDSFYELRVGGTPLRRGGDFGARDEFAFANSLAWRLPPAPSGGSSRAVAAAFFPAAPARLSGLADAGWAWGLIEVEARPPLLPPLVWLACGLLALALLLVAALVAVRLRRTRRPPVSPSCVKADSVPAWPSALPDAPGPQDA